MSITTTPALQILDWCGSALGLIGAYMLAFRFRGSRYGWFAFFAANGFYVAMASSIGVPGLLVPQLGYSVSSAIGIYRHFLSKATIRLERAQDDAWSIANQLADLDPTLECSAEQIATLVERARRMRQAMHGRQLPAAPLQRPTLTPGGAT